MNLVTTETTLVEASPICEHGNFNPEDFVCRDCQMTKREAVEREGVFRPFERDCWGEAAAVIQADTLIQRPPVYLDVLARFSRALLDKGDQWPFEPWEYELVAVQIADAILYLQSELLEQAAERGPLP